MAVWTFLLVDAPHVSGGGARGSLTTARSRQVTSDKDNPGSASWTMSYFDKSGNRSAEVALINPRATDVICYRGTAAIFRGRIKSTSVDYSEDGQRTVTVGALGYKYLLGRRLISDADCVRPTVLLTAAGATAITLTVTTPAGSVDTASITTFGSETAAALQTTLRALSNVGGTNATVTGATGGPFTITFAASLGLVSVAIKTSTAGSPTVAGGGPLTRNYASGADLASVAWDLIATSTGGTNETLGITYSTDGFPTTPTAMTTTTATLPNSNTGGTVWTGGNGNSGVSRNTVTQVNSGTTVLDAINQFAAGDATTANDIGFEWDVLPSVDGTLLQLHIWSLAAGGRGVASGYVLDYPGALASGSTADDLDNYANGVRTSGGDTVTALYSGGADATNGLYESQVGATVPQTTTVASQITAFISAQAAANYLGLHSVRPAYSLVIRPKGWLYGDCEVGDTVIVSVPTLEGTATDTQRILTQTYSIGDDGNEVVAVTSGSPPLFTAKGSALRQKAFERRVVQVEGMVFGGSG